MSDYDPRLTGKATQPMQRTLRAYQLLQVNKDQQAVRRRRLANLEYRMDFVMGLIQDVKAEWNVK